MGTHPIFESDFDCLTENSDKKQSVMPCARSMVQSKTFVTPSRCYEKARLDQELKLVGEFSVTSVKSGESNWPSPRSEKLPVPFLLLKKKTQRDCSKVTLFSVDWSELVSSQKTK